MQLTAENVIALFEKCSRDNGTPTEGIMGTVALDVVGNEEDIAGLLSQLPDEFHVRGGGGYTFLHACNDREGNLWTGLHRTMDQLFMLGSAAGMVRYCLPRPFWPALPGGMPYLMVDTTNEFSGETQIEEGKYK